METLVFVAMSFMFICIAIMLGVFALCLAGMVVREAWRALRG